MLLKFCKFQITIFKIFFILFLKIFIRFYVITVTCLLKFFFIAIKLNNKICPTIFHFKIFLTLHIKMNVISCVKL